MKFLHLADLHIGKRVNEFSMIEEQKQVLSQAVEMATKHQVTAVLIAGDIYDKSVPTIEGVKLFDSFLTELAEKKIPVCIISGNHDSAERLSFGNSLLAGANIHISGTYEDEIKKVTFQDEFGETDVYLLPYLTPRQITREDTAGALTYTEAIRTVLERLPVNQANRNLLLAHQFVEGEGNEPTRTDSETISVGGVDAVDYHVFDAFDYVALGHLHGAQQVGRETLRYAGSPVKYSFSEARQTKSATLVTLLEKGNIQIEQLKFTPLHDMREIRGELKVLVSEEIKKEADPLDYLHVTLTDDEDIYDALGKVRAVYPNLMQLDFDNTRTRAAGVAGNMAEAVPERSSLELFSEFFELQCGQPMNAIQQAIIRDILQEK